MSLSKALFWQDGSKIQLGSEGGTNFLSRQLEVLCAWSRCQSFCLLKPVEWSKADAFDTITCKRPYCRSLTLLSIYKFSSDPSNPCWFGSTRRRVS